ncbi:MAG: type 1 glutamine amidotransferase domain-containing protein [Nitrososphaeria archaeon]
MKALIITEAEGEDLEVLYPYYRLQEEGIEVHVAASKKGPVTLKHGYTLNADYSFNDVNPEQFDILVIPGGRGPEKVRLNKAAIEITKSFFKNDKPVAAICHGPQVLISANLLKGRTVTSWMGIRDDVVAAGGNYMDKPVVRDGNLVTSRMPSDLPSWMKEFITGLHILKQ